MDEVLERKYGPDLQLGAPVKVDTPGVLKVDGHKVVLRCDASGLLQSAVDADGIKRALTGTSAQDARTYLERLSGLAAPPNVDMTPPWAPRAPHEPSPPAGAPQPSATADTHCALSASGPINTGCFTSAATHRAISGAERAIVVGIV